MPVPPPYQPPKSPLPVVTTQQSKESVLDDEIDLFLVNRKSSISSPGKGSVNSKSNLASNYNRALPRKSPSKQRALSRSGSGLNVSQGSGAPWEVQNTSKLSEPEEPGSLVVLNKITPADSLLKVDQSMVNQALEEQRQKLAQAEEELKVKEELERERLRQIQALKEEKEAIASILEKKQSQDQELEALKAQLEKTEKQKQEQLELEIRKATEQKEAADALLRKVNEEADRKQSELAKKLERQVEAERQMREQQRI